MKISNYNEIGDEYIKQQDKNLNWRNDVGVKFLLDSVEQNQCVLDAGCGSGDMLKLIHEKTPMVFGIDKSFKMQTIAKYDNEFDVRVGDFSTRTHFPNNFLDVIVSRYAVHYLENFSEMYKEFHRILKPNGIMAIVAEHPIYDFKLNKKYESGIETKLDLNGVILEFPSHTLTDYFSKDFFKYFTLKSFEEGGERGLESDAPAYIAFRAVKNEIL